VKQHPWYNWPFVTVIFLISLVENHTLVLHFQSNFSSFLVGSIVKVSWMNIFSLSMSPSLYMAIWIDFSIQKYPESVFRMKAVDFQQFSLTF